MGWRHLIAMAGVQVLLFTLLGFHLVSGRQLRSSDIEHHGLEPGDSGYEESKTHLNADDNTPEPGDDVHYDDKPEPYDLVHYDDKPEPTDLWVESQADAVETDTKDGPHDYSTLEPVQNDGQKTTLPSISFDDPNNNQLENDDGHNAPEDADSNNNWNHIAVPLEYKKGESPFSVEVAWSIFGQIESSLNSKFPHDATPRFEATRLILEEDISSWAPVEEVELRTHIRDLLTAIERKPNLNAHERQLLRNKLLRRYDVIHTIREHFDQDHENYQDIFELFRDDDKVSDMFNLLHSTKNRFHIVGCATKHLRSEDSQKQFANLLNVLMDQQHFGAAGEPAEEDENIFEKGLLAELPFWANPAIPLEYKDNEPPFSAKNAWEIFGDIERHLSIEFSSSSSLNYADIEIALDDDIRQWAPEEELELRAYIHELLKNIENTTFDHEQADDAERASVLRRYNVISIIRELFDETLHDYYHTRSLCERDPLIQPFFESIYKSKNHYNLVGLAAKHLTSSNVRVRFAKLVDTLATRRTQEDEIENSKIAKLVAADQEPEEHDMPIMVNDAEPEEGDDRMNDDVNPGKSKSELIDDKAPEQSDVDYQSGDKHRIESSSLPAPLKYDEDEPLFSAKIAWEIFTYIHKQLPAEFPYDNSPGLHTTAMLLEEKIADHAPIEEIKMREYVQFLLAEADKIESDEQSLIKHNEILRRYNCIYEIEQMFGANTNYDYEYIRHLFENDINLMDFFKVLDGGQSQLNFVGFVTKYLRTAEQQQHFVQAIRKFVMNKSERDAKAAKEYEEEMRKYSNSQNQMDL